MTKIYVIAEIGNTHEGSLGLAKKFIDVAKTCGADAIKFQTHIFNEESTPDAPNPPYFMSETRKEYFERTAFNKSDLLKLKNYAEKKVGIEFMSSPFSIKAFKILNDIGVKIKIPSGEVTNHPLIKFIAKSNKEVILSSGMSSWQELDDAIKVLRENGAKKISVMQCTSEYPCKSKHVGLNVILEMRERYKNLSIGLSDHTKGIGASIAAVATGATIIEKHFTLSKNMYGSDAKNSLEPDEFKKMINEIRDIENAMNNKLDKDKMSKSLKNMKNIFEKSIYLNCNLKKGKKLAQKCLIIKNQETESQQNIILKL